jgi:NAD+ synthase
MLLNPSILDINYSLAEKKIVNFIKEYVEKHNFNGVVLGLSGGIDSCTVAALASQALGKEKVLGLILPEEETFSKIDINDARIIAKKFNIEMKYYDISKVLRRFYNNLSLFDQKDRILKANIKARTRMIYLYYFANKFNRLVCGTSDKSETMIGYFTKWGDGASDIAPIMDLFKSQVQKLAINLGIPKKIALKPPSPNLWLNQTAETEIGIKYEILDLILFGLEKNFTIEKIAEELKIKKILIKRIKQKIHLSNHKRRLPLTIKINCD